MRISKTILVAALLGCAAASPALADARSDVLAGIQRCGVIHDDRVWLDCVYGANQPMRGQLGLSPAPEFQQRLVPPAGTPAPPMQIDTAAAPARPVLRTPPRSSKKPGFFASILGTAPPFAVSRMASYRYEDNGAFVVALDNGQEWRQTEIQRGKVTWLKKPDKYIVTISQGTANDYSLHTNDSPQSYKVVRLK